MITISDAAHVNMDDHPLPLEVSRWAGASDEIDKLVVARCEPPVIDLGCGPGRMVQALSESGRAALGVDMSSVAVGMSMARGGPALRRRIDEPLPADGRWGTALLMDTNVGMGGDVAALLARCMRLVIPGGLIICEVDGVPDRHEVHSIVLLTKHATSPPLSWSRIGTSALIAVAKSLDLLLMEEWTSGGGFVALRSMAAESSLGVLTGHCPGLPSACLRANLHRLTARAQQARSKAARPLGIYPGRPAPPLRVLRLTPMPPRTAPSGAVLVYIAAAIKLIWARVLGPEAPEVSTIYVGGGTPTLLPPNDLGRLITAVQDRFGLAADAEVSTESNPESADAGGLCRLRALGFNRISFGMQSVVPHVLATLDRMHSPGRPQQAVAEAKAAGFANTSLDLIYGTPGETAAIGQPAGRALAAAPPHISAYWS
jgi:SAM-dependent methyltransferase